MGATLIVVWAVYAESNISREHIIFYFCEYDD